MQTINFQKSALVAGYLLLLHGTSCYCDLLILSLTRFSLTYPVIEGAQFPVSVAFFLKQTEGKISLYSINKVNDKLNRRLNAAAVVIIDGGNHKVLFSETMNVVLIWTVLIVVTIGGDGT